ncbi:hypothetical protein BU26DRAFT_521981 [Trematosphaeria pertusa]|uniref:Uncharacterized protein n=1 Tax=Trematosphaeria pertusa TaxID=390896 RepID=A0A6A6I671_9PLEO|nr:uncharacterized protein BU26DRAFT_521981 [Trematosphaeria pertusa]KAF2245558.1 hypothetical protein BU26DRAFT_521981 [Trematosphaeria pertusa]
MLPHVSGIKTTTHITPTFYSSRTRTLSTTRSHRVQTTPTHTAHISEQHHRDTRPITMSTQPITAAMIPNPRPSVSALPEKDTASMRSTSTATSMTSLLKSMWRSRRAARPAESPQMKSERKLLQAEARMAWAASR